MKGIDERINKNVFILKYMEGNSSSKVNLMISNL
jgi:hypothetical protein